MDQVALRIPPWSGLPSSKSQGKTNPIWEYGFLFVIGTSARQAAAKSLGVVANGTRGKTNSQAIYH
jgi:hypothetical protein